MCRNRRPTNQPTYLSPDASLPKHECYENFVHECQIFPPKPKIAGKTRLDNIKRIFIYVSETTKLIESVEISHEPADFLYFANQCYPMSPISLIRLLQLYFSFPHITNRSFSRDLQGAQKQGDL